jgi:hypothetical protein
MPYQPFHQGNTFFQTQLHFLETTSVSLLI